MNPIANRLRELALTRFAVTSLVIKNAKDPFKVLVECDSPCIGKIRIEPFSTCHFGAFQEFYDGEHPEAGLSRCSFSSSGQPLPDSD